MGLSNLAPQTLTLNRELSPYAHTFYNCPRFREYGPPSPPIDFPNQETLPGKLVEFSLLRSPQREIFGVNHTNLALNPDRVVYFIDSQGTVYFMGLVSLAGNITRNLDPYPVFLILSAFLPPDAATNINLTSSPLLRQCGQHLARLPIIFIDTLLPQIHQIARLSFDHLFQYLCHL